MAFRWPKNPIEGAGDQKPKKKLKNFPRSVGIQVEFEPFIEPEPEPDPEPAPEEKPAEPKRTRRGRGHARDGEPPEEPAPPRAPTPQPKPAQPEKPKKPEKYKETLTALLCTARRDIGKALYRTSANFWIHDDGGFHDVGGLPEAWDEIFRCGLLVSDGCLVVDGMQIKGAPDCYLGVDSTMTVYKFTADPRIDRRKERFGKLSKSDTRTSEAWLTAWDVTEPPIDYQKKKKKGLLEIISGFFKD